MATTAYVRVLSDPLGDKSVAFTQGGKDRTAKENITGAASDIYYAEINNTANSVACYLKVYDQVGTPTHGTTDPVLVIRAAAGGTAVFASPSGIAIGNAITALVATDGGIGTAGSDLIGDDVSITLLTA